MSKDHHIIKTTDKSVHSFSLSIDEPEAMAKIAQQVQNYPIIKVKLGGDNLDLARLRAIRKARPEVRLWVDANAGWRLNDALDYIPHLEDLGIEMLEQPLLKEDIVGMGMLQKETNENTLFSSR